MNEDEIGKLSKLDDVIRLRVHAEIAPIQADIETIKHKQGNIESGLRGLVPVLQKMQDEQKKQAKDTRWIVQAHPYLVTAFVIVGGFMALPEPTQQMILMFLGVVKP